MEKSWIYSLQQRKRKIEFTLITGKIIIYRTILQIDGDINLEKYNLKSKLIVPVDEYLGIDKIPFKISIKAMIEISFWGQNQPSFKKASEKIKRVNGITISPDMVKKVTEFIGNLLFQNDLENANKVWNERANINIDTKKDKLILYIEGDGAAVNTRIEDENGSTWKENKLAIFFDDKDMYKRKNKANTITHKEFVSYLGSVDTFRTLLFAKAVEMKYWEYKDIIFISDGATWLRNMIKELFPEAIQILDKYHLIENIYQYANLIFDNNKRKVENFKDKIIGYCYSGEYSLIVKELKKYKDIKIPLGICNLPTYLEHNKDKIDYSTYEHNGWFVGSGAIKF